MKYFRFLSQPETPQIADLPSVRLAESRPFSHFVLDFASYFTIELAHLRIAEST